MKDLYTVSELAREFNLTARAIRFYEDKGLLSPRRVGTTRAYSGEDRVRLQRILCGKRLGFSLREIGEWLDLCEAAQAATMDGSRQAHPLLAKLRRRLAELDRQRTDLDGIIAELRAIERRIAPPARAAGHDAAASWAVSIPARLERPVRTTTFCGPGPGGSKD